MPAFHRGVDSLLLLFSVLQILYIIKTLSCPGVFFRYTAVDALATQYGYMKALSITGRQILFAFCPFFVYAIFRTMQGDSKELRR